MVRIHTDGLRIIINKTNSFSKQIKCFWNRVNLVQSHLTPVSTNRRFPFGFCLLHHNLGLPQERCGKKKCVVGYGLTLDNYVHVCEKHFVGLINSCLI